MRQELTATRPSRRCTELREREKPDMLSGPEHHSNAVVTRVAPWQDALDETPVLLGRGLG